MFCRQKFLGVLFSSIVNETNKAISNLFISFYEKMLHTQKVQNRYKRTKTKNPSIFMTIKKRLRGGKSLVQLFASLCLLCFLCFLVLFVCVKFSRKKKEVLNCLDGLLHITTVICLNIAQADFWQ